MRLLAGPLIPSLDTYFTFLFFFFFQPPLTAPTPAVEAAPVSTLAPLQLITPPVYVQASMYHPAKYGSRLGLPFICGSFHSRRWTGASPASAIVKQQRFSEASGGMREIQNQTVPFVI